MGQAPNLARVRMTVNDSLGPPALAPSAYQGLSFQPKMKPMPRHHSAATSGFSRAYSFK